MLTFERCSGDRRDRIAVEIDTLIIAGWAGSNQAAIHHHIEELAAIGVPRPSSVPVYYRVGAANLTQADKLTVLGPNSSGEVEPVLVSLADGLWIGIGSDHTDRMAETTGIALSKQLCGKPVGRQLWRYDDVEPHWDQLVLRAWAVIEGERVVYQEGPVTALRTPRDLVEHSPFGPDLAPGTAMYCGTLGAIGGIRPASRFEIELADPKLGRSLVHAYDIDVLPVIS